MSGDKFDRLGDEFDRLGDEFDRLGDPFDRLGSEFDHLAGATRPQTAADLDRLRTVARRRRTRSALTGSAAALLLVGGVGVTVLPRILGQSAGTGSTTTTAGAPLAAGATSDSAKTAGSDTPAASDSPTGVRGVIPSDGSARANGEPDSREPDPRATGRGGPAPASGRGVVPVVPSTGGRLTATQTEALVAGWAAAYEARTSASDRVAESMPPVLHVDDVTRTLRGSAHTRLSVPLLITDLSDLELPAHPVGTRLILALDAEDRLIAQYVVSGTVATQAWPTASRSTSVLVSDLEIGLS